jgi:hypothetical protein
MTNHTYFTLRYANFDTFIKEFVEKENMMQFASAGPGFALKMADDDEDELEVCIAMDREDSSALMTSYLGWGLDTAHSYLRPFIDRRVITSVEECDPREID